MKRMRKSDRISVVALLVLLGQLVIGVLVVRAQSRDRNSSDQAVVNAQLSFQQDSIARRVNTLEDMKLPERLALLEKSAEEVSEVRKLVYGLVVSVVGSLLTQLFQIRDQVKRRGQHG